MKITARSRVSAPTSIQANLIAELQRAFALQAGCGYPTYISLSVRLGDVGYEIQREDLANAKNVLKLFGQVEAALAKNDGNCWNNNAHFSLSIPMSTVETVDGKPRGYWRSETVSYDSDKAFDFGQMFDVVTDAANTLESRMRALCQSAMARAIADAKAAYQAARESSCVDEANGHATYLSV